MESSIQIEEHAAGYLAKRDSGDWNESDQRQLSQWLDVSISHRVAYIRLEAAWQSARRLKALAGGGQAGVVPAPGQWQMSPFFTTQAETEAPAQRKIVRKRWLALAASIVVAVILGYYSIGTDIFYGDRYRTPVGGVASLPMADGSKITLNTDSEVRVALSKTERSIRLEQGEAFFEVAKDPERPFVVNAGKQRVVAVGTKFSVRREGDDVRVVVTEGVVRLERDGTAADAEPVTRLAVGNIARTKANEMLVDKKALPEAEEYLSWRSGYLVFREIELAEAVAEFNRYNVRKMVIADPAVKLIRLSGKFRSTNSDAFVRLLEEGFEVRAERAQGGNIVIAARRRQIP